MDNTEKEKLLEFCRRLPVVRNATWGGTCPTGEDANSDTLVIHTRPIRVHGHTLGCFKIFLRSKPLRMAVYNTTRILSSVDFWPFSFHHPRIYEPESPCLAHNNKQDFAYSTKLALFNGQLDIVLLTLLEFLHMRGMEDDYNAMSRLKHWPKVQSKKSSNKENLPK